MSATQLTLAIVIAVLAACTITLCTSMACTAWERSKREPADPRTDEQLVRDAQRTLRQQGRR